MFAFLPPSRDLSMPSTPEQARRPSGVAAPQTLSAILLAVVTLALWLLLSAGAAAQPVPVGPDPFAPVPPPPVPLAPIPPPPVRHPLPPPPPVPLAPVPPPVVAPPAPPPYYNQGAIIIDVPPPAPYEEAVPPPPFAGAMWIRGYWGWADGRHEWVPGRWETARPGYRYRSPAWVRDGRGWRLSPGGWTRR